MCFQLGHWLKEEVRLPFSLSTILLHVGQAASSAIASWTAACEDGMFPGLAKCDAFPGNLVAGI